MSQDFSLRWVRDKVKRYPSFYCSAYTMQISLFWAKSAIMGRMVLASVLLGLFYQTNSQAVTISGTYGEPAPRLITDPTDPEKLIWENIQSFGPVPFNQRPEGKSVCARLHHDDVDYIVVGFHPKAIDIDGKVFEQGAYFCLPK